MEEYLKLSMDEKKRRVAAEMRRIAGERNQAACSCNMWQSRDRFFPSVIPLYRSLNVKGWVEMCKLLGEPHNPTRAYRLEWQDDKTPSKVDVLEIEKGPLVLVASERYAKPYRYWDTVHFRWRETVARPCGRFDRVLA